MKLNSIGDYMRAGQQADAQRILREVSSQLQAPFNVFSALGEAELEVEAKQWSRADTAVVRLEQGMETHGFEMVRAAVVHSRARIAEGRGNCGSAIPLYEQKLALEPLDVGVHVAIGRCYLALNQPQRAIEHIEQTLARLPHHPRGNYEVGLAYLAAGNRAKAREHLQRAVHAWANADPGFEWAAKARSKLREVEGTQQ